METTVKDVMTTSVVAVPPTAEYKDIVRILRQRRVSAVPVLRVDVLSLFERSDERIRDEVVRTVIAAEFTLNPAGFGVTVRSGVVTITGVVDRRDVALTLLGAIRYVTGVVAVRDRLTYPAEDYPTKV